MNCLSWAIMLFLRSNSLYFKTLKLYNKITICLQVIKTKHISNILLIIFNDICIFFFALFTYMLQQSVLTYHKKFCKQQMHFQFCLNSVLIKKSQHRYLGKFISDYFVQYLPDTQLIGFKIKVTPSFQVYFLAFKSTISPRNPPCIIILKDPTSNVL